MHSAEDRSCSKSFSRMRSASFIVAKAASLTALKARKRSRAERSLSHLPLSAWYLFHCCSARTFSSVFRISATRSRKSAIRGLSFKYSSSSSGRSFIKSHAVSQFEAVLAVATYALRSSSTRAICASTSFAAESWSRTGACHPTTTKPTSPAPGTRSSVSCTSSKRASKRRRGTASNFSSEGTDFTSPTFRRCSRTRRLASPYMPPPRRPT
mmetsp:Transcript_5603/g.17737  ORF Transcript_5603/g.17737 Transcript_5603/m.17737 type:complete len:211 (+) Transcript_5603:1510-2142(+)